MSRRSMVTVSAAALVAAATLAPAAGAAPTKHPLREVEVGARLSTTGLRYEDSFRIKKSPWGQGSEIRDGALTGIAFPASGSAAVKDFFRNGRQFAKETYTLATPNVYGAGTITGAGSCTSGTGSHLGMTCTFAIKGTYNIITGVTDLVLTGTYTPAPPKKTKQG
jgi:hypothetical protein